MKKDVEIVKFIRTELKRKGKGDFETDPIRIITQYWDFEGNLVIEFDNYTKDVTYFNFQIL